MKGLLAREALYELNQMLTLDVVFGPSGTDLTSGGVPFVWVEDDVICTNGGCYHPLPKDTPEDLAMRIWANVAGSAELMVDCRNELYKKHESKSVWQFWAQRVWLNVSLSLHENDPSGWSFGQIEFRWNGTHTIQCLLNEIDGRVVAAHRSMDGWRIMILPDKNKSTGGHDFLNPAGLPASEMEAVVLRWLRENKWLPSITEQHP